MNKPKKTKANKVESNGEQSASGAGEISVSGAITSRSELKGFLLSVKDKMEEGSAAAVYGLAAMNHVMSLPQIYSLLDNENKELARDIWFRIKKAGFQLKNPPLLFSEEEIAAMTAAAG